MSLTFPVTLVIPILNEADSLPELLQAIKTQRHRPDEIIFVDAGSTDGSSALIEDWWCAEGWTPAECRVLFLPGAMPGAGRNAGISAARNNWIAFIDGGITPANDWLDQLCRHVLAKKVLSVFGVCHFSAKTPFSKAICALSYGYGSVHPVIPASLFSREVFDQIGFFPSHLRAAEDIVWVEAFLRRYGAREVCYLAQVKYIHFPQKLTQAMYKWRINEAYRVLAGVRPVQQIVFFFGLPILYIAACSYVGGGIALLAYMLLRGVLDPVRRSKDHPWWGDRLRPALIALPLGVMLDIAKWLGIIEGSAMRLKRCIAMRRKKWRD